MSDELLKSINRELKVTSLENSEKRAKDKTESAEDDDKELETEEETEEVEDEEVEEDKASDKSDDDKSNEEELLDIAKEQTDDVVDELKTNVLSSSPELLTDADIPVERNEIDEINDDSGILKDYLSDKTSSFIDPDSTDENLSKLKVVDTTLGVFTILNYDKDSVLLLDSNKQKIQISIKDFNNLHPFEVKDEELSDVNSFKDALERDKKLDEIAEENSESEEDNTESEESDEEDWGGGEETDEEEIEESPEEQEETQIGESLKRDLKLRRETPNPIKKDKSHKEDKNILTSIQKGLSKKKGVVETIRSDVRGKNRCVLVAKRTKTKDMNENTPKQKRRGIMLEDKISKVGVLKTESKVVKKHNSQPQKNLRKKTEITQPSAIAVAPKPLGNKKSDFNVNNIVTLKDGKYVLVKLEGKDRDCYLRLASKTGKLSINRLKLDLKGVSTFFESLDYISDNFYILEKETVMRKFRKFESEDMEEVEQEIGLEEETEEDDEELDEVEEDEVEEESEDDDSEEDEDEEESEDEDSDEQPDSIEYSTEINGVKYVGVLYAQDDSEDDDENSESEDDEDNEDEDEEEDNEDEESEEDSDDDLILTSEDELEELDVKEDKKEGVVRARAKIFGKRYNVTFGGLKTESLKKVKTEMRRNNIVGAWNTLVRGSRTIKC